MFSRRTECKCSHDCHTNQNFCGVRTLKCVAERFSFDILLSFSPTSCTFLGSRCSLLLFVPMNAPSLSSASSLLFRTCVAQFITTFLGNTTQLTLQRVKLRRPRSEGKEII